MDNHGLLGLGFLNIPNHSLPMRVWAGAHSPHQNFHSTLCCPGFPVPFGEHHKQGPLQDLSAHMASQQPAEVQGNLGKTPEMKAVWGRGVSGPSLPMCGGCSFQGLGSWSHQSCPSSSSGVHPLVAFQKSPPPSMSFSGCLLEENKITVKTYGISLALNS